MNEGITVIESTTENSTVELPTGTLIDSTDYVEVYLLGGGKDENGEQYFELMFNNITDEDYSLIVQDVAINSVSGMIFGHIHLPSQSVNIFKCTRQVNSSLDCFTYTDELYSISLDYYKNDLLGMSATAVVEFTDTLIIDDSVTLVMPEHFENVIYDERNLKISIGAIEKTEIYGGSKDSVECTVSSTAELPLRIYIIGITVNGEQVETYSVFLVMPDSIFLGSIDLVSDVQLSEGTNEIRITMSMVNTVNGRGQTDAVTFTVEK